jgi:hypothetical protein
MASRFGAAIRALLADHAELAERLALQNRPWEEAFLHWSGDAAEPHLHGQYLPPPGRRRSVTRAGWCLGVRQ